MASFWDISTPYLCIKDSNDESIIRGGFFYDEDYSNPASIKQTFPESNFWFLVTQDNTYFDFFADGNYSVNAPTFVFTTQNQAHNEFTLMGAFSGKYLWFTGAPGNGVSDGFPSTDSGMGYWFMAGDGGSDSNGGDGAGYNWKVGNQTTGNAYQGSYKWFDGDSELVMSLQPVDVGNTEFSFGLGVHDFNFLYKVGSDYIGSMLSANITEKQITLGDNGGALTDWTIGIDQTPVFKAGTIIDETGTTLDLKTDGVRYYVSSISTIATITMNGLSGTDIKDGTYIELINNTGNPLIIDDSADNIRCENSADMTLGVFYGRARLTYRNAGEVWEASVDFNP